MSQISLVSSAALVALISSACPGSTAVQLQWEHKSNPNTAIDRRMCALGGKLNERELNALMAAFLKSSNKYKLRRITIVSCDLKQELWTAQAVGLGSDAVGFIKEEGRPFRVVLKEGQSDPRVFMVGNISTEFFSFALSKRGTAEFDLRLKLRPSKEQAELISHTFADRMTRLGPKGWSGLQYVSWGYDIPSGPAFDLPERSWPHFRCYEGRCVLEDASTERK